MSDEQPEFRDQWEQIRDIQGADAEHVRRLAARVRFYVAIRHPDSVPSLLLEVTTPVDVAADDLISTDQVEVTAEPSAAGGTSIRLGLRDAKYLDLFLNVCDDIVPRVQKADDETEAAGILLRRFRTWRQFLRANRLRGLGDKLQLGLYGELKTLEFLLAAGVDPHEAVNAWTGPEQGEQDFQYSGIALEVKSIAHSQPQRLLIDGERQLDENHFNALVVVHHRVHRQRDAGEKLPEAVARMRGMVGGDPGAYALLDDKLLNYGYAEHDAPRYSETGYAVSNTAYYRVQPGFPRLTEADLPLGLGGVRYVIDASACSNFEVAEETVANWLSEPPPVYGEAGEGEDFQREFKATAWKPVDPAQAALERDIQDRLARTVVNGGIVKTVAAFLNTSGGELVIGMADDGSITGIEQDMAFLDVDRDGYQRKLVELLFNNIDKTVTAHLRLEFREADDATTCHILVRPSPSPRFANDLENREAQGQRRVFYHRAFSTTRIMPIDELPTYLAEHF